ncbi:MAG: helix-turn-helix domain-containing protein [Thiotrichaceae bacterium]|nr:helix-turn-helix domain-containing protein [Thiotrichaceae bacterium]PCI12829.1 MAG: hypothetical protein COB71_08095 [Thiotrichales bacterium]
MKRYKQLAYEQRCQIYALKKSNMSQQAIADTVGATQPTISRELRRHSGERGYRFKQAPIKNDEWRAEAIKAVKMTPDMIKLIESKLYEKWGSEQISGWLLEEHEELLSYETI